MHEKHRLNKKLSGIAISQSQDLLEGAVENNKDLENFVTSKSQVSDIISRLSYNKCFIYSDYTGVFLP